MEPNPLYPYLLGLCELCSLNLDLDPNDLGPTLEPNLASLKGCFYSV